MGGRSEGVRMSDRRKDKKVSFSMFKTKTKNEKINRLALRISFFILFCLQEKWRKYGKGKKAPKGNYERMLALAAHALAEVLSSG